MKTTLKVYYGNDQRWNQSLLNIIQEKLKRMCDGFDGLQADFVYHTYNEATAALFVVRGLNVRAQIGETGMGPSERAIWEAQQIMQEAYRKEHE
jgi:hypothetical protein